MSRSAILVVTLLAASLAGCVDRAADDVAPAATLLSPRDVVPTGVVRAWDLYLDAGTSLEVGGRHPFTFAFTSEEGGAGTIPGPELRVKQGDTVRVSVDGHHTIHWHGVRLPWAMDGVPGMTQVMGDGRVTYAFVAKDAGTFWYHCHVAAPAHVDWGMFGALIVEPTDPVEDPPFEREYTLFLHEMDTRSYATFDLARGAAGENEVEPATFANRPASALDTPEHARENAAVFENALLRTGSEEAGVESPPRRGYQPKYDLFMINGKVFPDTEPLGITMGETVRIRLVNAGQLTHAMHLHGHRFLVTHKDGALLAAPYLADTIGLFPGERYDIYILGDNPGHWDFHDHGGGWGVGGYAATNGLFPGGMQTTLVYEDWEMQAPLTPVAAALTAEAPPTRGSAHVPPSAHGGHRAAPVDAKLPLALGLLA